MDSSVIDMKTQGSPDKMESLDSCCTGVDHEHSISPGITDNLQNMRVPTYEYIGMISVQQFLGPYVISSGVSPNMRHQDMHALA